MGKNGWGAGTGSDMWSASANGVGMLETPDCSDPDAHRWVLVWDDGLPRWACMICEHDWNSPPTDGPTG